MQVNRSHGNDGDGPAFCFSYGVLPRQNRQPCDCRGRWSALLCLDGGKAPSLERSHVFLQVLVVVKSLRVVIGDVFVYCLPELVDGSELLLVAVEHLVLHGSEEALHDAVVEAVALPRHRLQHPLLLQQSHVLRMAVLPSLVGVEYGSPEVTMGRESLGKHPLLLVEVRAQRKVVGDDLAGVHVLDRGKVQLGPADVELAHVGGPLLVGPAAAEVGLVVDYAELVGVFHDDSVRRFIARSAGVGIVVNTFDGAAEAHFGHQTVDFAVFHPESLVLQHRGDLPSAISVAVFLTDCGNLLSKLLVLQIPVLPVLLVEIGRFRKLCDKEKITQRSLGEVLSDFVYDFGFESWRCFSSSTKALNFFK